MFPENQCKPHKVEGLYTPHSSPAQIADTLSILNLSDLRPDPQPRSVPEVPDPDNPCLMAVSHYNPVGSFLYPTQAPSAPLGHIMMFGEVGEKRKPTVSSATTFYPRDSPFTQTCQGITPTPWSPGTPANYQQGP